MDLQTLRTRSYASVEHEGEERGLGHAQGAEEVKSLYDTYAGGRILALAHEYARDYEKRNSGLGPTPEAALLRGVIAYLGERDSYGAHPGAANSTREAEGPWDPSVRADLPAAGEDPPALESDRERR